MSTNRLKRLIVALLSFATLGVVSLPRATAEGSIPIYSCSAHAFSDRSVVNTDQMWQNGQTLNVHFLDGDRDLQMKVARYALEWTQYANINFRFFFGPNEVPDEAHIRVSFQPTKGDGYWSALGTASLLRHPKAFPRESMGLTDLGQTGEENIRRVSLHEFGHALGLQHEQHHPEVGIPWDKEAAYEYYMTRNKWDRKTVDHNVFQALERDNHNYTEYDPLSIMHYPIPNDITIGDFSVGRNTRLSDLDKRGIASFYPGRSQPNHDWTISIDPAALQVDSGQPFTTTASVSGNEEVLVKWYWGEEYSGQTGHRRQWSINSPGTYTLIAVGQDQHGRRHQASISVNVNQSEPKAISASIVPDPVHVMTGTDFQTVGHATGGVAPYTFEWFWGEERSGIVNQAAIWSLNRHGEYNLRVLVTDSWGNTGEQSARVLVHERSE